MFIAWNHQKKCFVKIQRHPELQHLEIYESVRVDNEGEEKYRWQALDLDSNHEFVLWTPDQQPHHFKWESKNSRLCLEYYLSAVDAHPEQQTWRYYAYYGDPFSSISPTIDLSINNDPALILSVLKEGVPNEKIPEYKKENFEEGIATNPSLATKPWWELTFDSNTQKFLENLRDLMSLLLVTPENLPLDKKTIEHVELAISLLEKPPHKRSFISWQLITALSVGIEQIFHWGIEGDPCNRSAQLQTLKRKVPLAKQLLAFRTVESSQLNSNDEKIDPDKAAPFTSPILIKSDVSLEQSISFFEKQLLHRVMQEKLTLEQYREIKNALNNRREPQENKKPSQQLQKIREYQILERLYKDRTFKIDNIIPSIAREIDDHGLMGLRKLVDENHLSEDNYLKMLKALLDPTLAEAWMQEYVDYQNLCELLTPTKIKTLYYGNYITLAIPVTVGDIRYCFDEIILYFIRNKEPSYNVNLLQRDNGNWKELIKPLAKKANETIRIILQEIQNFAQKGKVENPAELTTALELIKEDPTISSDVLTTVRSRLNCSSKELGNILDKLRTHFILSNPFIPSKKICYERQYSEEDINKIYQGSGIPVLSFTEDWETKLPCDIYGNHKIYSRPSTHEQSIRQDPKIFLRETLNYIRNTNHIKPRKWAWTLQLGKEIGHWVTLVITCDKVNRDIAKELLNQIKKHPSLTDEQLLDETNENNIVKLLQSCYTSVQAQLYESTRVSYLVSDPQRKTDIETALQKAYNSSPSLKTKTPFIQPDNTSCGIIAPRQGVSALLNNRSLPTPYRPSQQIKTWREIDWHILNRPENYSTSNSLTRIRWYDQNQRQWWTNNNAISFSLQQKFLTEKNETHDLSLLAYSTVSPVKIGNTTWPSIEHYLQALKFEDVEKRCQIYQLNTAQEAIDFANKYKKNWRRSYDRKTELLKALSEKATQDQKVKKALLATQNATLIYDEKEDSYLGCGNDGRGENQLGLLWMSIRTLLQEQTKKENTQEQKKQWPELVKNADPKFQRKKLAQRAIEPPIETTTHPKPVPHKKTRASRPSKSDIPHEKNEAPAETLKKRKDAASKPLEHTSSQTTKIGKDADKTGYLSKENNLSESVKKNLSQWWKEHSSHELIEKEIDGKKAICGIVENYQDSTDKCELQIFEDHLTLKGVKQNDVDAKAKFLIKAFLARYYGNNIPKKVNLTSPLWISASPHSRDLQLAIKEWAEHYGLQTRLGQAPQPSPQKLTKKVLPHADDAQTTDQNRHHRQLKV